MLVRNGAEIVGGTLNSENDGTFVADTGVATLDGVTNDATFNVLAGDELQLETSLTNNGTITINSDGVNADSELTALGSLTIDGTGDIVLNNNIGVTVPQRASVDAALGETITQGADHTISGQGQINAALINNGTVSADGTNGIVLNGGDKTNNGVFEALDGSTLSTGTGTSLTNLSGGVLTGGTYRVINGGNGASAAFNGSTLTDIAAGTEIVLSGANSTLTFDGVALEDTVSSNSGTVRILDNRDFELTTNVTSFNNFGLIELGGGTLSGVGLVDSLQNNAGANFTGFGTLDGPIGNAGNVNAIGGTLTISTISGAGVGNSVNIAQDAALDVSNPENGDSSTDLLSHAGTDLALGANNFLVTGDYDNANAGVGNAFDARTNVSGTGQILASPGTTQTITGDVTNGTQPSVVLDFGNVRVGSSNSLSYAINNDGTSGPDLRGAVQTDDTTGNGGNLTDARLSGSGTTAGNFDPIGVGEASDNLDVTFNATTAGSLNGQQVAIVNNFDNVDNQVLSVTGAAFNAAQASVTPTTFDFGIVHVGDVVPAATFNVANVATAGLNSEDLRAENIVASGNVSLEVDGPLSVLVEADASSEDIRVLFGTSTAGVQSGLVSVDLVSTGQVGGNDIAGLGELGLGTEQITFTGQVNNFAFADLFLNAGDASLTSTGANEFLLDFGTLLQSTATDVEADLALLNNILGPADTLTGDFILPTSDFSFSGFDAVGDIAAGDNQDGFLVGLSLAEAGLFDASIIFNPLSENASGFSGALPQLTINVAANVVPSAIPEPGTFAILTGCASIAALRRRRA